MVGRHDCSANGVIVCKALMNYIREKMDKGEKVHWEIGFPKSQGIIAIQMVISTLAEDFEVVFISG